MSDERNARRPDDISDERSIPRFVKTLTPVIILLTIFTLFGAWRLSELQRNDEQATCDRQVAVRDDNRAMWEWLFEQFPDDAAELGGPQTLNDRLPRLECVNRKPVPREP